MGQNQVKGGFKKSTLKRVKGTERSYAESGSGTTHECFSSCKFIYLTK